MAKITHTIAVHPDLLNSLEVTELKEAGHTILVLDTPLAEAYRIFAPNAWRMYGPLLKYLPVAMKAEHKDGITSEPKRKAKKPSKCKKRAVEQTQLDGGSNGDEVQITESAAPQHPPQ